MLQNTRKETRCPYTGLPCFSVELPLPLVVTTTDLGKQVNSGGIYHTLITGLITQALLLIGPLSPIHPPSFLLLLIYVY